MMSTLKGAVQIFGFFCCFKLDNNELKQVECSMQVHCEYSIEEQGNSSIPNIDLIYSKH